MKQIKKYGSYFLFAVVMVGFFVALSHSVKDSVLNKDYERDLKKQELAFEKYKFDKELILECQKISATTFDEDWKYTSCIKAVGLLEIDAEIEIVR